MNKTSPAQRDALRGLGVEAERIYVDHGSTGTNRERPGLRVSVCGLPGGRHGCGDQARPFGQIPLDAQAIADELTTRQISLSLGIRHWNVRGLATPSSEQALLVVLHHLRADGQPEATEELVHWSQCELLWPCQKLVNGNIAGGVDSHLVRSVRLP